MAKDPKTPRCGRKRAELRPVLGRGLAVTTLLEGGLTDVDEHRLVALLCTAIERSHRRAVDLSRDSSVDAPALEEGSR